MYYVSLDEQTYLASAQSDPHGFIHSFTGKPIVLDEFQQDNLSIPENFPTLNREQLAQTLINGGYPELQSKSPRARQIWFSSYIQGRLLKKPQQLLTSTFFGGLLESFIVMECFKQMAWADETMNIYHFRDVKKNEVDIVLEQADGNLIGIEVKASSTVRASDFKGLKKFAQLVGDRLKYGLIFYTGARLLPFSNGDKPY
jgi:predicted AAA+ superfamily ATPase